MFGTLYSVKFSCNAIGNIVSEFSSYRAIIFTWSCAKLCKA